MKQHEAFKNVLSFAAELARLERQARAYSKAGGECGETIHSSINDAFHEVFSNVLGGMFGEMTEDELRLSRILIGKIVLPTDSAKTEADSED